MASSVEERDIWINTINAALIGSAGDFEGVDSSVVFSPHSSVKGSPGEENHLAPSTAAMQLFRKTQLKKSFFVPYTDGIQSFTQTRESVRGADSAEDYRSIIQSLIHANEPLVVPVSFAKVSSITPTCCCILRRAFLSQYFDIRVYPLRPAPGTALHRSTDSRSTAYRQSRLRYAFVALFLMPGATILMNKFIRIHSSSKICLAIKY